MLYSFINVVIRSDGRPTYYASDIAYHFEKFAKRNFSRVIDVWGADHHGHVERLKIATNAVVGYECDLQVLLYQFRPGKVVLEELQPFCQDSLLEWFSHNPKAP